MLTASSRSPERTSVEPRAPWAFQPGGIPTVNPARRLTTRVQPAGRRAAGSSRSGGPAGSDEVEDPDPPQPTAPAAHATASVPTRRALRTTYARSVVPNFRPRAAPHG